MSQRRLLNGHPNFEGVFDHDSLKVSAKNKDHIISTAVVENLNTGKTILFHFISGSK